MQRNAHFIREKSGLIIDKILKARFKVAQFLPLKGRGHQDVPQFLQQKRAIINVQNNDNRCFAYAILSALEPIDSSKHPELPAWYTHRFDAYGLNDIEYPVAVNQVPDLEEKLKIRINIFSFHDDKGIARYPIYISKKPYTSEVDLLYWAEHYAWIKSFSRFMGRMTKHKGKSFWCKRCLGHFSVKTALDKHHLFCQNVVETEMIFTMPAEGSQLKFKNIRFVLFLLFISFGLT